MHFVKIFIIVSVVTISAPGMELAKPAPLLAPTLADDIKIRLHLYDMARALDIFVPNQLESGDIAKIILGSLVQFKEVCVRASLMSTLSHYHSLLDYFDLAVQLLRSYKDDPR